MIPGIKKPEALPCTLARRSATNVPTNHRIQILNFAFLEDDIETKVVTKYLYIKLPG